MSFSSFHVCPETSVAFRAISFIALQNNSFDKYGRPFFMLSTNELSAPAGYTLFSQALFFSPGFGPEENVHPAIAVNHACDTKMAEFGKATTNLLHHCAHRLEQWDQ